jgi:hypothetical protein
VALVRNLKKGSILDMADSMVVRIESSCFCGVVADVTIDADTSRGASLEFITHGSGSRRWAVDGRRSFVVRLVVVVGFYEGRDS